MPGTSFIAACMPSARGSPEPLRAALVTHEVRHFPGNQHEQERPEADTIAELVQIPRGAAEALEGTEGDVLLIGQPGRILLQPPSGRADHPGEIALPELLGGVGVAGLESSDPDGDRVVGHGEVVFPSVRSGASGAS